MASPDQINCETFQVRVGVGRWSANRGLAVTEVNGRNYLDPQIEPRYNTSLGRTDPANLRVELSKSNPPQIERGVVKSFSIAAGALENLKSLRKYRIRLPLGEKAMEAALVSVVNHDSDFFLSQLAKNRNLSSVEIFQTNSASYRREAFKPFVQVVFMRPGEVIEVSQDTGLVYSRDIADIPLMYDPESIEGLVFQSRVMPPPTSDTEGGVREPRNPILPSLESSTALKLPTK